MFAGAFRAVIHEQNLNQQNLFGLVYLLEANTEVMMTKWMNGIEGDFFGWENPPATPSFGLLADKKVADVVVDRGLHS